MAASSKKNERRFHINGVGEREDFSARLEAIEGVTSCEVTYQGYTRTECLVQIRVPSGDTKSFTLKVGAPFHGRCSATLACLEGADEGELSWAHEMLSKHLNTSPQFKPGHLSGRYPVGKPGCF
jgi:hypothetical protein